MQKGRNPCAILKMEEFMKEEEFPTFDDLFSSNVKVFASMPLIKRKDCTTSSASSAQGFHIVFTISSAVHIYRWILYEGISTVPELQREIFMPLKRASVHVTDLHEQVPEFIVAELRVDRFLSDEARLKLVDFAMKKAWQAVELVPSNHGKFIYLDIGVVVLRKFFQFEIHEQMDRVIQHSMDVHEICMVPAQDSSMESLKKKKVLTTESGTCPVCLENFSESCEAVSMPCLRFFHEDCVKKWLRRSHYCPICRFEMPTS